MRRHIGIAAVVVALLATGAAYAAFAITTSNPGNTVAASSSFGTYRSQVLADAPRAYWRLGETSGTTAADASGNGNAATYTNGPQLSQPGGLLEDPDGAATFDGTDDHLVAPDAATLDLGDSLTIEAWVKRGATGSDRSIVEKDQAYELYFAADDKLTLRKAGVADVADSTVRITDSQWHHVVATKTGATVRLYVDGADVTGAVTNQTLVDTATPLRIGQMPNFDGSIDEVAVYDAALSVARVKAHFRAGRPYAGVVLADGPAALWRLGEDGARTQVAFDSVGTGHGLYRYGVTRGTAAGLLGDADTATTFDGADDLVEVPDAPALDPGDTLSLEAWVRPGAGGTDGRTIIDKGSGGYALRLMADDRVHLRQSGAGDIATTTVTVADASRWHHVVATKSGATVRLYVDGRDVTGAVTNQTIAATSAPLLLGQGFAGSLDDVAVYDRALSQAEVADHFEAGRPYREEVAATTPVSWWRLGESGGNVWYRAAASAALTSNATSFTITKPAGVAQNDVLVAVVQESGGSTGTPTPPAGWTSIASRTVETNTKTQVYWKLAGASEPANYAWTAMLSGKHSGGIVALGGANTAAPIDAVAAVENTASLSVTCPSVTTTSSYGWLLLFPVTHDGATFSFPSAATERFDVRTGTTSIDRTTAAATEPLGLAGATGTRSVTNDNPYGFSAPTSGCISVAVRAGAGTAFDHQHVNNGSYGGNVVLNAAGGIAGDDDRAARFDGSTGFLSVPDSASLDIGDTMTIEAWVKRASTADGSILEKGGNACELWITGNRLTLRKNGVADIVQSTTTITDTTDWHHVVGTKAGGAAKLYVDGADVTGTVTNQTCVNTTAALDISGSPRFNGWIDEVALYGTALTPAQVAAHARAGRG